MHQFTRAAFLDWADSLIACGLTTLLAVQVGRAEVQCPGEWLPGWGRPEIGNDSVWALASYKGEVVAAGDFKEAGGIYGRFYVARWDGRAWQPLGGGLTECGGTNCKPIALCLAVFQGELIVGGNFKKAGGQPTSFIARWNGTQWNGLPDDVTGQEGANNAVYALTVWNDKLIAGGLLTAAGGRTARRVAAWDGHEWGAVGEGFDTGYVRSLTVHDNGLIAGGDFAASDGLPVYRIARWTGLSWQALDPESAPRSGLNTQVYSLAVHDGNLIAGGDFTATADGTTALKYVGRWDGSGWTPLDGGTNQRVRSLVSYQTDLIVGGGFTSVGLGGGVNARCVAAWNGATGWRPLGPPGSGTDNYVLALLIHDDNLIAAGSFGKAGDFATVNNVDCGHVAKWDGTRWWAIGDGLNGDVLTLCAHQGSLHAGGQFTTAGGQRVNYISRWSGANWGPLCIGMDNAVYALTVYAGELVAGGAFQRAGHDSEARYVARWDGINWHAIDSIGLDGIVEALTVYRGNLIAAGRFMNAGGTCVNGIARWDGVAWSDLCGGVAECGGSFPCTLSVKALTTWNDRLIAGGAFTTAGGVLVNYVAQWDGECWEPIGPTRPGMSDPVSALGSFRGDLIAGGSFTWADQTAARRIARWNGTAWQSMGSGVGECTGWGCRSGPRDLVAYDDDLYVGGNFTDAGGVDAADYLARWDGSAWYAIGNGPSYETVSLEVFGDRLVAGGGFLTVAESTVPLTRDSSGWARWGPLRVRADFDCDGDVDSADMSTFDACATGPTILYDPAFLPTLCSLSPDARGRIAADFDEDGDVDQADFGIFQRCYSGPNAPVDPACAAWEE